ncbi:MAG: DegT/DnrJ/EryC1/StrS family aminotransferase [Gemmatimonadales bacterium]
MFGRQLPVYSPISFGSVVAGWRALLGPSRDHARTTLERAIADKFDAREIILTDSGTTALSLAINGICSRESDRTIALPAYGCYDLATAADGVGVDVVLYDLDPHTLGPDLESLRAAVARGPATVVAAYLFGVPIDLLELTHITAERGIAVIEDAAQGHGATYDGAPLGSFGSPAVLSFGRGKGMTGGAGGALVATTEIGAEIVRGASSALGTANAGLREVIGASAQWGLARPSLYGVPAAIPFLRLGETIYREPQPPATISKGACCVLASNWEASEAEAATRGEVARRLYEIVAECTGMDNIVVPSNGEAGYLRLPVLVSERVKHHFDSTRARRLGIMPGYPKALADLPGFGDRCVNRGAGFPGARCLANRLFTLPTHSKLTTADIDRIERWLHSVARNS